MPFSYSWALVADPDSPTLGPIAPSFPAVGGVAQCNGVSHDQAHFLGLFDRCFPEGYLQPMKANPDSGYEQFQALAKVGERVSTAIERFECGSFIIFAQGGAKARVTVELSRPDASHGAVVVSRGTVVTTSRGGRDFVTLVDVSFGPSDVGPFAVVAEAVDQGWEWNVPGQVVTAAGQVLAGDVDEVRTLVTDPPYGDPTIQVAQLLDASGGRAPMLDGLGEDRGLPRLSAEPDASYQVRVRALPDTVSPGAIVRALEAQLGAAGIPYEFIEIWQIDYQTSWDAPSPNFGTPSWDGGSPPANPLYDSNLFAYDDERPPPSYPDPQFRGRYLDLLEYRGAFIVVIGAATILDVGFAYDDPGTAPSDFRSPTTGRQRGTPAFDVPADADPDLVYPAAWDGVDVGKAALLRGLYDTLQRIKLGGVAVVFEQYNGLT